MFKRYNPLGFVLAFCMLFTISCNNDPCDDLNLPNGFTCDDGNITCNTTCSTGEVLSVNCTCIVDASTITPDPCAGTTACEDGFVKEASTCNCIEIMPTTVVDVNQGFLASSLDAFGPFTLVNDFMAPSFYDIGGVLAPGAYNGQIRRIAQLQEIVDSSRNEPIRWDIANAIEVGGLPDVFASPAAQNTATSSSDLRSKIDELNFDNGDQSVADAFADLADSLVLSSQANFTVTAANGFAGMITTGSTKRHVSTKGLEYIQILEKGMYGPLLYDQMVDDYLRLSQSGPDNPSGNNESAVSNYASLGTDRQHRWDEAFGYLGANPDTYPNASNTSNGDGSFLANYIFDYSDEAEAAFGINFAQRIMDAYILGRSVLKAGEGFGPTNENVDEALLEACRQDIKLYVEAGIAAAAFHYLNLAIDDVTDEDKLHHLSEAYGFIYSLSFNSEGRMTEAEAYDVLEELGWPSDNQTLTGVYDINLWEITDEQMEAARVKLNGSFPGFIDVPF
ncbi:MAG: DUF4856 domain-containing protein [Bacteroidota bacterium]